MLFEVQSNLLADRIDISTGDSIGTSDVIFEIHFVAQIHSAGHRGEDETFLSSIRQRKFDFSIQSTGTEESRIQRVGTVRRHDHLRQTDADFSFPIRTDRFYFDVDTLIESVHLIE